MRARRAARPVQLDLFGAPPPRPPRPARARAPGRHLLAVNSRGLPVGEDHHNAILTDAEVDLLLMLHEREGWGYGRLAEKFEVSKSTARSYCTGRMRCQRAVGWKEVHIAPQLQRSM